MTNPTLTPTLDELAAEQAEKRRLDREYLENQRDENESLRHFDRHMNRAKLGLTPRAIRKRLSHLTGGDGDYRIEYVTSCI